MPQKYILLLYGSHHTPGSWYELGRSSEVVSHLRSTRSLTLPSLELFCEMTVKFRKLITDILDLVFVLLDLDAGKKLDSIGIVLVLGTQLSAARPDC